MCPSCIGSRLGCVGLLHGGAPYLNMAEYVVSSLLRPDGTVQTTSQVTLDHLPNFINGNEMQLFVQTHGLVHQHNVQAHSSSRDVQALSSSTNVRAVRKGEWTRDGRRAHDDQSLSK